jgi:predicted phage terminase large subunit-like protein
MRDPAAEVARIRAKLAGTSPSGIVDGPLGLTTAGRMAATRSDPAAFAWTYLRHHLKDKNGDVSFSSIHLEWAESAKRWMRADPEPMDDRRSEVAPRESGKSTWHFLILPMWAAAHGHKRFAAAFANTPSQAETQLASFKAELGTNALLRLDYPDLCEPKTRGRGTVEADRVSLYHAKSDFVFAASGMDSSNLGLKVGAQRPDLLIMDDIEPHEANYSPALAAKRLDTLRSAILPLNIRASVVLVGTVTMPGSVVHQIVQSLGKGDVEQWVAEERIVPRHFPAMVTDDEGERRSIWPEKWPTEMLKRIEHTRTYLKNYANDPRGNDGPLWSLEDFTHRLPDGISQILVSIDPAVTQKASSDFTGLAVVGRNPGTNELVVLGCWQVKLDPERLRHRVIELVDIYDAAVVLIETNQGGDLWHSILHDMPVKVRTVHQSASKEVRAASAYNLYQRGTILHAPGAELAALEAQMTSFPNAPHDDMVDAVVSGVLYFASAAKKKRGVRVGGTSVAYN